MKRILLILIMLFPIVSLAIWVYMGLHQSGRTLPPGVIQTNSTPQIGTNINTTKTN
jgi:hypothetical protein